MKTIRVTDWEVLGRSLAHSRQHMSTVCEYYFPTMEPIF
jgi:hypothetical protein